MKQFQDFDWYYHKKTIVSIGAATYEIWHLKVIPSSQVEDIARAAYEREMTAGREAPSGAQRLDLRSVELTV